MAERGISVLADELPNVINAEHTGCAEHARGSINRGEAQTDTVKQNADFVIREYRLPGSP
jgi:hypothetical protein